LSLRLENVWQRLVTSFGIEPLKSLSWRRDDPSLPNYQWISNEKGPDSPESGPLKMELRRNPSSGRMPPERPFQQYSKNLSERTHSETDNKTPTMEVGRTRIRGGKERRGTKIENGAIRASLQYGKISTRGSCEEATLSC